MSTTFPTSKQSFTDPSGTQTLSSPDHTEAHVTLNDTLEAVQDALGYGGGTNIQKDFVAGDFPVRHRGGTLQDTINRGTVNNSVLGTPAITGGTANAQVIGTPAVTGGTYNSGVFGTPTVTLGSDTSLDTYYRSSGGTVTRLPAASFLVVQSTDTTALGNGTPKQIAFDTEVYDVGGNWNTTNKNFIAPVAGYYTLYVQAYFYQNITSNNYAEVQILHNGTVVARGRRRATGTATSNELITSVETRRLVPAGGTIDFWAEQAMGHGTVAVFANTEHTFAWGKLDAAA